MKRERSYRDRDWDRDRDRDEMKLLKVQARCHGCDTDAEEIQCKIE